MKQFRRKTDSLDNTLRRAKYWIKRNTVAGNGVVITSRQRRIYQEVTGYYIPTLLHAGMQIEAVNYAKWLCRVQQPDGAWLSSDLKNESVFNTGQVLRGLVAICDLLPETKEHIVKGADWLVSNIRDDGRMQPTVGTYFDKGVNSELIHVYCLSPMYEISEKTDNIVYKEMAKKSLEYYKRVYQKDIMNFNYLSHFYAYVIEAMVDLGEFEIAKTAMEKIAKIQRLDGAVPAYKNVHWICSTGLFQFAVIWFKLGNYRAGKKAFEYAIGLQNESGGWFGGYPAFGNRTLAKVMKENITYFPEEEISWAVKYFMDALFYKNRLERRL